MAWIGVGVAFLLNSELLNGVVFIGGGVAVIGFGVAELRDHAGLVARLRALISAPPTLNGGDNSDDAAERSSGD